MVLEWSARSFVRAIDRRDCGTAAKEKTILLFMKCIFRSIQPPRRPQDSSFFMSTHLAIDSDLRQEIIGEKDERVERVMKWVAPA